MYGPCQVERESSIARPSLQDLQIWSSVLRIMRWGDVDV